METKKNNGKVIPQTILELDDDFSLIKKFISGDEYSFRQLVNRHKEKVRNLIYLTLGNTDNIDDISQDVFISVYSKLKYFRFESQFSTWLYRITINKCRDHLRKIKVRSIFFPFSIDEMEMNNMENFKEDFDTKEIVQKAIAKLPKKLSIPLILKDFEGFSYEEIADTLNSQLGTIKSRIFRAREGLKKILEPFEKELL